MDCRISDRRTKLRDRIHGGAVASVCLVAYCARRARGRYSISAAPCPSETRNWAEGFRRGVNAVIDNAPLPPDMELFGLGREPSTLTDLFTAARLAGADVTWIVWARLLRTRGPF
jgi:acyl-homoserine lactone acylase PvdQ